MKVAIVGASDSVDKIYNTLCKTYTDVEFILKKEEKISDTLKVIERVEEVVDGIYLTGVGVYYALLNNELEVDKPIIYTKRGSIGLIKSFWELKNNNIELWNNLKLGIDVIEEKILLEIKKEFNIEVVNYFYQKYDINKSETEYLEEYLKKYEKGEINCVFTAFGYIYQALKEMNIPVYRIQATDLEIENEFKILLDRIKVYKIKQQKIGIQIIRLGKIENELSLNNLNDKLEIQKILMDYSKEMEGNIQLIGESEYIIISNSEILKDRDSLKKISEIGKIINKKNQNLFVGIGEGNTIFQAEKNARIALKVSLSKENSIYFFNGEEVRGPLLSRKQIEYKKISDDKINNLAKEIGISPTYIEKIKGMIKKQEKKIFTSAEISQFLNITERSTNRIIKKIIEKKYAEESKLENSITAGRPRRQIKFLI